MSRCTRYLVEEALRDVSSDVPGMAAYVFSGKDQLEIFQYFGYEDLETRKPVTAASRWAVQSITKNIAATTAAWMVGRGEATFEANIHEELATVSFAQPYFNRRNDARRGLSHTTGLPGLAGNAAALLWVPLEKIYKTVKEYPLAVGDQVFRYSNLGITLGFNAMVAQAGYQSPVEPMQEFAEELGMDVFIWPPNQVVDLNGIAVTPYFKPASDGCPTTYRKDLLPVLRPYTAADGVVTDLPSLAKFVRFHLDQDQTLIPRAILEELYEPVSYNGDTVNTTSGYGLGTSIAWFLSQGTKYTVYGHAGGYSEGLAHQMLYDPERQIGVVILTNTFTQTASVIAYYLYTLLAIDLRYANQIRSDYETRIGDSLAALLPGPLEANRSVPLKEMLGKYYSPQAGYAEVFERGGAYRLRVGRAPSALLMPATEEVLTISVDILTVDGQEVFGIRPAVLCGLVIGFELMTSDPLDYFRVSGDPLDYFRVSGDS